MYDFANILFSGRCNARCRFCIGRQIDPAFNVPNLGRFPPQNLDRLLTLVRAQDIRQVVVTGTNTDPQLYRHEVALLALLRSQLPSQTQISLHTNGLLAVDKIDVVNGYDRVSLSIPSLDPQIYRRMMGVATMPDLLTILQRVRVPVKVSCLVSRDNGPTMARFLAKCRDAGVARVVLRKLMGERRSWSDLMPWAELDLERRGSYRNNPIYDYGGMEVTLWDFQASRCRSLNLFASGDISDAYLLTSARHPDT